MALYYIGYENWGVFRTGDPLQIMLEIGKTIFSVDVAIEENTVAVVTGEVTGIAAVLAVISIVSALATLSMWLRAGAFILMRWNRNYGVVDAWGWPFVIYGFLAFAASVAQGDPRVPFAGLATLVMNFDQVFDPEMLRTAWMENSSVGRVRDVPYVMDHFPDWVSEAANETGVDEYALSESMNATSGSGF
ncbi:hypothetical protein HT576_08650 [Haloterrigena sp. SYSU A121-1]|uniref:Uncharacterized protein n=1 Tax=Haloterrigena gelatinilytica TaxID=2741724 RepID=A0A8J8GJD6_9EURY|nr:hypothetical protein [Haloterrigena gelatinilytica]NUB91088.1 hypothetical protein [Haloterrigena gelatinilytica]